MPYFKGDKAGDKVLKRNTIKKEEEKTNAHLENVEKIVHNLLGRNKQVKEKLEKLREESEK
jgi:hypothetical protein